MKYFDKVRLIVDRERYKKDNIFKGEIGTIWLPEIRDNEFYVVKNQRKVVGKRRYKKFSIITSDTSGFFCRQNEELRSRLKGKQTFHMLRALRRVKLQNKKSVTLFLHSLC